MSNPVISNFGRYAANGGGQPTPTAGELEGMYNQPAYGGPRPGMRYMTLDSVVQRTAAMLGTVFLAGAITWVTVPADNFLAPMLIGGLGGFAMAMFISFTQKANAATCLIYAALEGIFLGAISHAFETWKPGIVIQAVIGTAMVAGGMLFVYKIGAIRVTPRFTRIVVGALIGVVGLMLVNIVASFFTDGGLGLRDGGPIAVIFSLVCIAVAAFMLVLDFDMIEQGIRQGMPEKFAWYGAFGLTVTLVWLYLEILRLIGYARD